MLLPRKFRWTVGASVSALSLVVTTSARADEAVEDRKAPEPPRAWLYGEGADNLEKGRASATSTFTYTDPTGAMRPLAMNVGVAGALYELRAHIGVGHGLSVEIAGANEGFWNDGAPSAFSTGLSASLFANGGTRISAAIGALRETTGSMGAWATLALSEEVGRFRLLANVHGEHVVAPARDALDLMVTAGASYKIVGPLRAGMEYVAQDIEAAFDDTADAEGGMRHLIGPTLAIEIPESRFSIAGGPAFGLSAGTPSSMARAAIAYSF